MARRVAAWILVVFLVSIFAGCVDGDSKAQAVNKQGGAAVGVRKPAEGVDFTQLTQPVHQALAKTRHYLPAAIGRIQLYTEVFLPDGPGPWPAILINSPYYDHGVNGATSPDATFRNYFVPRGYAVVLADVRGTGYSEGCMDMMGAKEQRDTYDLVEWVANQTWSDGKVGMYGVSYVGTTPHEALMMAPPHLVTVVTVAGVTNQWRNTFQNGVPYSGRHYPLTYEVLEGAPPPTDPDRGTAWAANVAAGACEQEEAARHMAPGTYEKGVYDAYWKERNFTLKAHQAKASIFYNQGFTDRAVNPMEAIHWFNELNVTKKAFLGQWPHRTPAREDWQKTLNAWFDYWLKGIDNGILTTPIVEVITNTNEIRTGTEWPPKDATPLVLHLSDGKLGAPPTSEGSATYLADNAARIEAEAREDVGRPTRLRFVTEPLEANVHMAGIPWAHLRASVNAENTYFLLSLYEVRDTQWTEVAEGWMNAHLWESFEKSSPLTAGRAYSFHFKFEPREYVFQQGNRIGLAIKGHDARVMPFDKAATENTIRFGGAEGSRLELPILEQPVTFPRGDI